MSSDPEGTIPEATIPEGTIPEATITVTIGPRRFGGRRDVLTLVAFAVALALALVVAAVAGLPGWIGTVYVLMAAAVWAQGFRRAWRIGPDRIEARQWFGWRSVERGAVDAVHAARDEMGIRAVSLSTGRGEFEIDADDVRVEPLLAAALARFVDDCRHDGATVDPAVPPFVAG